MGGRAKWDGWRCLARIDGGRVRLTSRWRNDLTTMFAELGELPSEIADRRVLLDGEVVVLRPDGSQDFHALTGRRTVGVRLAFMPSRRPASPRSPGRRSDRSADQLIRGPEGITVELAEKIG